MVDIILTVGVKTIVLDKGRVSSVHLMLLTEEWRRWSFYNAANFGGRQYLLYNYMI